MIRFSKLFVCVGLVSLAISSSVFALFPAKASAAVQAIWVNQATLSYNGASFKESNDGAGDANWHFYEQNPKDGCADRIEDINYHAELGPYKTQTVHYKPNIKVAGGCSFGNTTPITLNAQPPNYNIAFIWQDSSTIQSADGGKTFVKQGTVYVSTSDSSGCKDYLQLGTNGNKSLLTMVVRSNKGNVDDATDSLQRKYGGGGIDSSGWPFVRSIQSAGDQTISGDDCHVSKPFNVQADPSNANQQAGSGGGSGGNSLSSNGGSCESKGGALSWALCPLIELLDSATNALDNAIQAQLKTPDPTQSTAPGGGCESGNCLKDTWGRVRNIALIILLPIMMIMVIGTAIGYSGLDAYTVKRAMPRLLIAVIFISLSWYITTFLVNLTNVVGAGIYGLLTNPFGLATKSLADMVSAGSGFVISGGLIFAAIIGGLAGFISIGIILSLAMVTALAFFVAFAVLVLRNVFIYALILLAPLAILVWIFPNNDKLWKIWWGTFSKLLLMYPLIMVLIASGKIFASIIPVQQGGGSGLFTNAAIIIAYIAPYFFIPATFKFAGGLFANIAGMVNDRSRGFFDKQRERRAKERKELHERAAVNRRFNPTNRLTKRFNSAASWAADPYSNLALKYKNVPGLSGTGHKIASSIEHQTVEQSAKLFEELNKTGLFNDKAYRAMSGLYGGFDDATKERLVDAGFMDVDDKGNVTNIKRDLKTVKDINAMADILAQSSSDTERNAANVLRGSAGTLTSLWDNPETSKASIMAAGALGLSAHGFASSKDLTTFGNNLMSHEGMHAESAQALVSQAQVAGQAQRPDVKAGYGTVFKNGKFVDGMSVDGGRAISLLETLSQGDIARAKSGFVKDMHDPILDTIKAGTSEEATVGIEELKQHRAAGMTDEEIKEKVVGGNHLIQLEKMRRLAPAMKDEIFQAASRYSQSSTDTKTRAKQIIKEAGLDSEFELLENRGFDPARDGVTPPDAAGGAGGPAPGPGPGP